MLVSFLRDLLWDARYGMRMLVKQPLITLLAVLSLALGLGASASVIGAVRGSLLHALPYPDADGLVHVWLDNSRRSVRTDLTSYPNFEHTRQVMRALADLGVYRPTWATITARPGPAAAEPERLRGAMLGSNVLRILGVPVAHGRGFEPSEDLRGTEPVVLLGHGLWQRRFGADPDVLASTVEIDGVPRMVVGITPEGFDFPGETEIWLPMALSEGARASRGSLWLHQIGRLAAGVSRAEAQLEMEAIASRLQEENPEMAGYGLYVQTLREHLVGGLRTPLVLLSVAVALFLLIVCANVSNLLIARIAGRREELAVRMALGAGFGRMIRLLVTESVALTLLGGACGLAFASGGLRVMERFGPAGLGQFGALGLDEGMLFLVFALALATGVVVGVVPALGFLFSPGVPPLLGNQRIVASGTMTTAIRRALVGFEVALAVILLVGSGLLLRSLDRLLAVDLGFRSEGLLIVELALPASRYDEAGRVELYRSLVERLRGLPGVESVAAASNPLLDELARSGGVTVEGVAVPPDAERLMIPFDSVTEGFFSTLELPLLAGRAFRAADDAAAPRVAIINEAMARHYWQTAEASLGRRLRFGFHRGDDWPLVVGVVADARRTAYQEPARPCVYFPHAQLADANLAVLVRTDGDQPRTLVPAVREVVRELDRGLPLANVGTLDQRLRERVSDRYRHAVLLAFFAILALFLSVVGVYAVVSHLVDQQRREIGLRRALGARGLDIVAAVLRQGLAPVAWGLVTGLLASAGLARALRAQLFEVGALDPWTYCAAPVLLLLVAALATLVAAARASALEPWQALRHE